MAKKKVKKDFEKQKLRVGKSKPASTTATSTSFVAKRISVPTQATRDTPEEEFSRTLSLCRHAASSTRKESVAHLRTLLASHRQQLKQIITAVSPLMIDPSQSVRDNALQLFEQVPADRLEPHVAFAVLFVHSAMTHLSPEIRTDSTKFLTILLKDCPQEVSRVAFTKTIECFMSLLGWEDMKPGMETSSRYASTALSLGRHATSVKMAHLEALRLLLSASLDPKTAAESAEISTWIHPQSAKFALPLHNGPYVALQLFKRDINKNDRVTEDLHERLVLVRAHKDELMAGLKASAGEGGHVGRLSAAIQVQLASYLL